MAPKVSGPRKSSETSDAGQEQQRTTRKRRRPVLNLGNPFMPIDDFVNQSEDAVALGYRVLESTVEEIKKGYEEAQDFNRKQKIYEATGGTPPAIPWETMVKRVQNFQDIAFNAVRTGTDILFDSIKSATQSSQTLAGTWTRSREDVDPKPVLAGPVFEDPVEVTARRGERPDPVVLTIRHPGLTRLRIHAVVDPRPVEIQRPRPSPAGSTEVPNPGEERVEAFAGTTTVSFGPATESATEVASVLKVDLEPIPRSQKPGLYEGFIRASNFELLIARLRIQVLEDISQAARKPESSKPGGRGSTYTAE